MRSTGWGAGGPGLAGYRQSQDQAVYGLNGKRARDRGRLIIAPTIARKRRAGSLPPHIPIASPLTFSPLWDRIMGHDRPDGASTVHTAGTERAPTAESAHGKADGRRPYQRARRRARSPSRTRRTRGSVPLRTWVAPRRQALSSRDKGRERLFAGKCPQKALSGRFPIARRLVPHPAGAHTGAPLRQARPARYSVSHLPAAGRPEAAPYGVLCRGRRPRRPAPPPL